ncbi:hypothetical protein [Ktedonospora formicarum]|uniref:Uncharacterized protein n=1 Tax=Ktedonospora formicarum TaxID=2778364 RepID=A0A8J3HZY0_9CHLR|nr:hypothetical protein [Ktedonospora formicarum]GHO47372.1 hypothetical protein KSX_55350 [Ktedonospora formicarum]
MTQFPSDLDMTLTPSVDRTRPLTPFQEAFALSVCPKGTRIRSARPHRTVQLPCPIWVELVFPDGEERQVVVRMNYCAVWLLGSIETMTRFVLLSQPSTAMDRRRLRCTVSN